MPLGGASGLLSSHGGGQLNHSGPTQGCSSTDPGDFLLGGGGGLSVGVASSTGAPEQFGSAGGSELSRELGADRHGDTGEDDVWRVSITDLLPALVATPRAVDGLAGGASGPGGEGPLGLAGIEVARWLVATESAVVVATRPRDVAGRGGGETTESLAAAVAEVASAVPGRRRLSAAAASRPPDVHGLGTLAFPADRASWSSAGATLFGSLRD